MDMHAMGGFHYKTLAGHRCLCACSALDLVNRGQWPCSGRAEATGKSHDCCVCWWTLVSRNLDWGRLDWPTWTKAVLPAVPRPSSLTMARVMRLSDLPPPPPLPLVSVVTPAAPPPLSYLLPQAGQSASARAPGVLESDQLRCTRAADGDQVLAPGRCPKPSTGDLQSRQLKQCQ